MGRMKDRAIENLNGGRDVKVVMLSEMCGPNGNAFPNTVQDFTGQMQTYRDPKTEKEATMPLGEYLVANRFARPFDPSNDNKLKRGLVKAER